MFDVGFWELALIGVVALLILGPERLPGVARTAGLWMGRARRFLADVKADIDKELKSDELRAIREVGEDLKGASRDLHEAGNQFNEEVISDDTLTEEINKSATPADTSVTEQPDNSVKVPSDKNAKAG